VTRALLFAVVLVGCTSATQPTADESAIDQAATVCGKGPTVKGIDVSYYQGTIDWTKKSNWGYISGRIAQMHRAIARSTILGG